MKRIDPLPGEIIPLMGTKLVCVKTEDFGHPCDKCFLRYLRPLCIGVSCFRTERKDNIGVYFEEWEGEYGK